MSNLLYIIAVVLIIAWAIGFFAYSAGNIIHILLVIAIIAILLRVIQGKKNSLIDDLAYSSRNTGYINILIACLDFNRLKSRRKYIIQWNSNKVNLQVWF